MTHRGFTLIELMLVVVIMAVVGALTLPTVIEQDDGAADAAARVLGSDLEHAQLLALARPDRRIGLSIDADGRGWQIVDADNPTTPLQDALDASDTPRVLAVRCGEGRAAVATDASVEPAGDIIVFDPLGGLEVPGGSDRVLTVSSGDAVRVVSVRPDTGFIAVGSN